ncbi:MAG: hypothetical protein QGH59_01695, partial [Gemmatimonadota bacterium]|nr:hypothetical protein [Gemmatimonadota bacterium]
KTRRGWYRNPDHPVRVNRHSGLVSPPCGGLVRRVSSLLTVLPALLAACSPPGPTAFDPPGEPQMLFFDTYDGAGQVVHPDVARFPGNGPLWMAVTPYPWAGEKYENPSVYRSGDGIVWKEPAPGVNPIVGRPPYDHNCDPDLVVSGDELLLFFLETQRREYRPDSLHFQDLRVVRSPDGIAWSDPETVLRWDLDTDPLSLSPAIVRVGEKWRLYAVQPGRQRIIWLPSADLTHFGEPAGELTTGLPGIRPWHIDLFPIEGGWCALLCARRTDAEDPFDLHLWLGASVDLNRWAFRPEPLLENGPEFLDTNAIYRSTGLVEGGRLAVWFSARTAAGRWFVGSASWDAALVTKLLTASAAR